MVQKYQSPVRTYQYPFELIMAAYVKRWPTCKFIPALLSSEIIFDETTAGGAIITVERRIKMKVDAPYVLRKLTGVDHAVFVQRNTLNKQKRTLEIEAWNESFESRLAIKENCVYAVHPDNERWTSYVQEAELEIHAFFGFESTVEKLAIKQYLAHIAKGKDIMQFFIDDVLEAKKIEDFTPYEESKSNTVSSISTHPDDMYRTQRSGSVRLGEDYIAKCLGELSISEESTLIRLKQWLEEHHKLDKVPNDAHLVRFLKARSFDLEDSTKMICESLLWRKRNGIDRLLDTYLPNDIISKYLPGGWLEDAYDKEGRPIFFLRLGQMDLKGLLKSVGPVALEKHIVYTCEEGLEKYVKATVFTGHPVNNASIIIDLDGLTTRHLWTPGLYFCKDLFKLLADCYPETLGKLWVVRAPRFFPVAWTMLSPFIEEETRKKFLVYAGNDHLSEETGLHMHIEKEYIPQYLLENNEESASDSKPNKTIGALTAHIPTGGLVPRSLYRTSISKGESGNLTLPSDGNENIVASKSRQSASTCSTANESGIGTETDSPSSSVMSKPLVQNKFSKTLATAQSQDEPLYMVVSVAKTEKHEVPLEIAQAGSVIMWDFDVVGGCFYFEIRCLKLDGKSNPDCVQLIREYHENVRKQSIERLDNRGGDASQLLSRGEIDAVDFMEQLKEKHSNLEHSVVHESTFCQPGDSVQGTLDVREVGIYILQWRPHLGPADSCMPGASGGGIMASTFATVDSLLTGAHKSVKLMYSVEVIPHEAFKGSMHSLHSVASAFSPLALDHGHPSQLHIENELLTVTE